MACSLSVREGLAGCVTLVLLAASAFVIPAGGVIALGGDDVGLAFCGFPPEIHFPVFLEQVRGRIVRRF